MSGLTLHVLPERLAVCRLAPDAPIPEALDDLRWTGPRRAELESLCERLGETALLDRI